MSTDSNTVSEPTIFSAVITPNRSLDRVGFIVLMSLVSFVSFVGGMVFFIAGAWPVVGFLGLDVALLYWAFKLNYARAAAYEEVTVTAAELTAAQGEPPRRGPRIDAQPAMDQARPRGARRFRLAPAVPGVARPPAFGRQFPRAAGTRKLRRGAVRGAERGQARADAGRAFSSQKSGGKRRPWRPRWRANDGDRHALARPHFRPRHR